MYSCVSFLPVHTGVCVFVCVHMGIHIVYIYIYIYIYSYIFISIYLCVGEGVCACVALGMAFVGRHVWFPEPF